MKTDGTNTIEFTYDKEGRQIEETRTAPCFDVLDDQVYAGGRQLVTYTGYPGDTHTTFEALFDLGDWQGTMRAQTLYNGTVFQNCVNLPYGDGQACDGASDPSPLHYTDKMRDTETGLDYFGARYYSSSMGHWMSPDWAGKPAAVPYANYGDPQSLNLYAMVTGNPISRQDSDGHIMSSPYDAGSLWGGGGSGPQGCLANESADARGICGGESEQVLPAQQTPQDQQQNNAALAGEASNAQGSQHWDVANQTAIAAGKDKCNEFVDDMVEGAGRDRPRVKCTGWRDWLGLTRDPSAKEWATRDIPGYSAPMPTSSASKGDIIAVGHTGDAQGHVGIYVGGSGTASANWYQGGAITINNWGFRPTGQNDEEGGTVVVRKWLGTQ